MTKVLLTLIPTLLNISDLALRNDRQKTLRNVNIRGKQYARKSSFLFGNEGHTAGLALCPSAPTQACPKPHLQISVSPQFVVLNATTIITAPPSEHSLPASIITELSSQRETVLLMSKFKLHRNPHSNQQSDEDNQV